MRPQRRALRLFGAPVALAGVLVLAGCGGGDASNQAASMGGGGGPLTGLYEGGNGPRRNQLCLIEREGRSASFGFIVWGPQDRNCSGSGLVARDGEGLRLRLDGDDACTIEARLGDGGIAFASSLPPQCARYYCGDGASLAGSSFERVASEESDALRAVDLVGDPLCGDQSGAPAAR